MRRNTQQTKRGARHLRLSLALALIAFLMAGCGVERPVAPDQTAESPGVMVQALGHGQGHTTTFIVEPGQGGVFEIGQVAMLFGPDAVAEPLHVTIRDQSATTGEVVVNILPQGYGFGERIGIRIGRSILAGSVWNRTNVFTFQGPRGPWVLSHSQGPYGDVEIDIDNVDEDESGDFGRAGW